MANVLTHVGMRIVTGRLLQTLPTGSNPGNAGPRHVAWGTGTTTAAATQTALVTEASETRVVGTDTQVTTTNTNDTYQVTGTITATGNKNISEAGLFDASSAGNMFIRGDFTAVPLLTGDSIAFTFKWQIT